MPAYKNRGSNDRLKFVYFEGCIEYTCAACNRTSQGFPCNDDLEFTCPCGRAFKLEFKLVPLTKAELQKLTEDGKIKHPPKSFNDL